MGVQDVAQNKGVHSMERGRRKRAHLRARLRNV
jgi:hypothetical protein